MAIAAPFPTAAPVRPAPARARSRSTARRGTPGPRPALTLTRRGRIALGVVLSVPFAATLMVVGSLSADAGTSDSSIGIVSATGTVVVQPGESLWQIARQVAPHSDPRETLMAIRELNGLGSDTVVPGQSLVVPAHS